MSHKTKLAFKIGKETLFGVIGDEDTVTGFLLAGIGDVTAKSEPNFMIVNANTSHSQIEETFKSYIARNDISIILINQHIADDIRYLLEDYHQVVPAIVEIPSSEQKYDPQKDYILTRVKQFFGGGSGPSE